jgi:hydrogenase small subunit
MGSRPLFISAMRRSAARPAGEPRTDFPTRRNLEEVTGLEITRRDLLKYAAGSAAALGLSRMHLTRLETALAANSRPPVIWLSGQACTGCSVSLLNAVNPTIDQVLLNTISLNYHPNVMAAAGDLAVSAARSTAQAGGYILVVEGAIPTASSGRFCYVWDGGGRSVTMADAVSSLAATAQYVVAVGSCASFGGIPATYGAAGAKSVSAFLGKPMISLPGCPAHPDWIIGSLVQILTGPLPALDSNNRPTAFYKSQVIHDRCPRREEDEASGFGQDGRCLEELGCKGPRSHADCDTRKWNNAQNWCIGANGLCIGCVEPNYPAFPFHSGGVYVPPQTTPAPTNTPGPSPTPTRTPTPVATVDPGKLTHKSYLPLVSRGQ